MIKPKGLDNPPGTPMFPDLVVEIEGRVRPKELVELLKDDILQRGLNYLIFYGIDENQAKKIAEDASDYVGAFSILDSKGGRTKYMVRRQSPEVEIKKLSKKTEREFRHDFGEELRNATQGLASKIKKRVKDLGD